jgi:hypothetical protein
MLEDIVMNALHSDNAPRNNICLQLPGIEDLRQAVADLKWCENVASRGVACLYCGPDAQHNTAKCPRLMSRCFKCGAKGHSRQTCKEERVVPDQFCCHCLLPLWTMFEDRKVQNMIYTCIMRVFVTIF